MKDSKVVRLDMKRGARKVFIGYFPSYYRAEVVACRLEWNECWKPVCSVVRIVLDEV